MILILLSWLYISFSALSFGISFSKVIRIQQFEFVITTILGLFSVTLFATIWAFFGSINILFHIFLLLFAVLFAYKNKETFILVIEHTAMQIRSYSLNTKVLLAVSCILALAQSATLPFIIDNESYYIQTIKWLNEYGFVKGLANLHLFLGQTSGWHIAQSVYSFSFLYDRFNDLNGFCMLLGTLFAFQKLHAYLTKGNRLDLLFGLLPLTYVFLFQFISSPSPDLPVYLFGFILFSVFLDDAIAITKGRFIIVTVIALFIVFIKIMAIVLLVFPLVFLIKRYRVLKDSIIPVCCIGTLVLVLLVIKNAMLTGYPLFPLTYFRMDGFDYTVPAIIMDFFFSKNKLNSFYIPYSSFDSASLVAIITHYFFYNGMAGYFGIASVLTLIVTPFVLLKKRLAGLWTVYFAFICMAVLLFFTSPQYRFYVYFTMFFWLLFVSLLINNPKWIMGLCTVSLTVVGIVLFVPMSFGSLTRNTLLVQNSTFHLKNVVVPEPNSKWEPEYKGGSVGNMYYHSPIDTSFFWVTGNGPLPCVNDVQIKYFEEGFFYIPQQRSIDLNDGFYAQKVSGHE